MQTFFFLKVHDPSVYFIFVRVLSLAMQKERGEKLRRIKKDPSGKPLVK